MSMNPLGGLPRNMARGLQLTSGKAPRMRLRRAETRGPDKTIDRPLRGGGERVSIKPIRRLGSRSISVTRARPLTGFQRNVRTIRAGAGARPRRKVW